MLTDAVYFHCDGWDVKVIAVHEWDALKEKQRKRPIVCCVTNAKIVKTSFGSEQFSRPNITIARRLSPISMSRF